MTEIALNNTIIILTLYMGALIFAMQHVADRYSPRLIGTLLNGYGVGTLVLLIFSGFLSGIFVVCAKYVPPEEVPPGVWDGLAAIILLGTLIGGLVLSYLTWNEATNGIKLINSLTQGQLYIIYKLSRTTKQYRLDFLAQSLSRSVLVLQEILLKAIGRDDRPIIIAALNAVLITCAANQEQREKFMEWLVDHRDLLASDWMTRTLLGQLMGDRQDSLPVTAYGNVLHALLIEALDDEAFPRALEILSAALGALQTTKPWTTSEADLLYQVGAALWYTGEPRFRVFRTVHIPGQLSDLQTFFVGEVIKIWNQVKELRTSDSLEAFSSALIKLISETPEEGFITLMSDVVSEPIFLRLPYIEVRTLRSTLDTSRQEEGAKWLESKREKMDDLIQTLSNIK